MSNELRRDFLVPILKFRPRGRNTTWEDGVGCDCRLREKHPGLKTVVLNSGTVIATLVNGNNPIDVEQVIANLEGRLYLECQERCWDDGYAAVICGCAGEKFPAYFVARGYRRDGVYARFCLAYRHKLGLDNALLVLAHRRVAVKPRVYELGLVVDGTTVKVTRKPREEHDGLDEAIARAKALATGEVPLGAYAEVANPQPVKPRRRDEYLYQGERDYDIDYGMELYGY